MSLEQVIYPEITVADLLTFKRTKYNRPSGAESDEDCITYGYTLADRDSEARDLQRLLKEVMQEGFHKERKIFIIAKVEDTGEIYICNGGHMREVLHILVENGSISPETKVFYNFQIVPHEADLRILVEQQNQEKKLRKRDIAIMMNKESQALKGIAQEMVNNKATGLNFPKLYETICLGQGGVRNMNNGTELYPWRHEVFGKIFRFARDVSQTYFTGATKDKVYKNIMSSNCAARKLILLFKSIYDISVRRTSSTEWGDNMIDNFIQNGFIDNLGFTDTVIYRLLQYNQKTFAKDISERVDTGFIKLYGRKPTSREKKKNEKLFTEIIRTWAR